ncbi:MAG: hypothetical protein R3A45_09410 [Bdellovibrionota bacterium]
MPDSGSRYVSKVFNAQWLDENGFAGGQMQEQNVLQKNKFSYK